ncbi:O-acetyltransferase [Aspergillus sclerotiicarbonarius CBS 121057]|uniref:O-acetyltransferase n=1 Tax=Aspergillus sclerotiicarbonarius (strain CBS 121057 / IBT 28362) TaxID=1448318 RepID=A0A319EJL5_ASPSB|nr:O-acetyltransferase [Aspergillus sclerotiicarbonarius CBS 121057]
MTVSSGASPYILSPLDHTMPKPYISFFLSFPLETPQNGLLSLQKGLTELIHRLPVLARDIVLRENADAHQNVQVVLESNEETNSIPMLQVKHHPTLSLQEIATQRVKSGMENLHLVKACAPLPDFIHPLERRPILRFAANLMKDGILLVMTINHSFCDGSGTDTIIEALAECCRMPNHDLGSPIFSLSDRVSREGLALLSTELDLNIDHSQQFNAPGATPCLSSDQWSGKMESLSNSPTSCRLELPGRKLEGLKKACNQMLSATACADWPLYVSSNNVVSALICICRNKCRGEPDSSKKSELTTLVNLRSRVEPPFPDYYLGNQVTAVRSPVGSGSSEAKLKIPDPSPSDELGIGYEDLVQITTTAAGIRQSLLTINSCYVRSLLSYLQRQKDWNEINLQFSDLTISSWRDWKVYRLDFGTDLGAVSHFHMHYGVKNGLTVIMPAGNIGADWDMQLMIEATDWPVLKSSPLFQWAFGDSLS